MSKLHWHNPIRAVGLGGLLLASTVIVFQACTDLDETPLSAISPENFYRNEAEVLGGLTAVYGQLRNTMWGYFEMTETSTDETIVPTRGSDWFDNGIWLELFRHTWTPTSTSARAQIAGAWGDLFTGITRANYLLNALESVDVTNEATIVAEIRTLRAFYYFLLQDSYGGVPIVTDIEIKARPRNTRKEVFDFIESELIAAREDLPDSWPADQHGRVTKGAADAILASLYLNAGVFTKDDGINATSYNSCSGVTVVGAGKDACQAAVDVADRILNSGVYSLATDWISNFEHDNYTSPENIFVMKNLNQADMGWVYIQRALHYNQFTPSPWNGFSIVADAYYKFDADDERTQIFLVGCQKNLETGEPVKDRQGNDLCFTPEIKDITAATEAEGVRMLKWPHDPNHVQQDNGNDFAFFRLAEIMLIRAEALNELGSTAQAITQVNAVRARVFDPDEPLTDLGKEANRQQILDERLFELTTETKRRQDLIRHGQFTREWGTAAFGCEKDCPFKKAETSGHRVLMPIPQNQIDSNPLLEQNPGY